MLPTKGGVVRIPTSFIRGRGTPAREVGHPRPLLVAVAAAILLTLVVGDVTSDAVAAPPALSGVTVQTGLTYPWDVAFTPGGQMLVTERTGTVRVYASAAPGAALLRTVPIADVWVDRENGVMGIAVDPSYAVTGAVYLCVSRLLSGAKINEVVSYTVAADGAWSFDRVLLSGMAVGAIHNGCALEADSSGHLWVSMGDSNQPWLAQDPTSLNGKILRINLDGSIPADNPTLPGASGPSPVYTMGHRNPQGIAIHPVTGAVYAMEHGPELDDEINLLVPGGNYGWPCYTGHGTAYLAGACGPADDYRAPAWASGSPTIAASGGGFATGASWGELEGSLFMATLKERDLRSFSLTAGGTVATQTGVYFDDRWGRLRAVARDAAGSIYSTTSNGTGDVVVRISPDQDPTPSPTPTPTPTPAPSVNLLSNPGFEADANGDGAADGWTMHRRFSRAADAARSGAWGGRFAAADNKGGTVNQQVAALAGASYDVSGWVAVPATGDAFTFTLKLQWRGANGTLSTVTVAKLTRATAGWVPVAKRLVAPAKTTSARLILAVSSLNATINVDDLSISRAGS